MDKKYASNSILMKSLAAGAGAAFIFSILGYFIMFFFKIIAARYYGPSDFGVYALSQTILSFCVILAGLGLNNGIMRYIPVYKHSGNKSLLSGYLTFVFTISMISSLAVAFGIFFFSGTIALFFNFSDEFSLFLRIIALIIPLTMLDRLIRQIFLAEKKVFYNKLTGEIVEKGTILMGMLVIFLFKLPILFLIILLLVSRLISLIIDITLYKMRINIELSERKKYLPKEWFYFSIPLLFMGFFGYIISWSDNLIIGKFLDSGSLGIYSIAYSFAMFIGFFQASFSSIFLPLISESYARKKNNEISFLFRKSSAWIFGLTLPLFLVIILYSKKVLEIFYGDAFASGYPVLIIVAVGYIINVSTGLNSQMLVLHKKTVPIFYINILVAITNIILNIILIPVFGIIGAAISSSLSMALQNILLLFIASKYEKLSFDWIYNLKFIVAGIPAVLIAASLFRLEINIIPALFLSGIAYLVIYLALLFILRTFRKDDLQLMLAVERKLGINLGLIKKIVKKAYGW